MVFPVLEDDFILNRKNQIFRFFLFIIFFKNFNNKS